MSTVRLQVILSFQSLEPALTPARVFLSTLAYSSDTPLRTVVAQVLLQHALATSPEEWTISFEGRGLTLNQTLAQAIPGVEQRASVTLFLCPVPFPPVAGKPRTPAEPSGPSDDEDAEYELSLDEDLGLAPKEEASGISLGEDKPVTKAPPPAPAAAPPPPPAAARPAPPPSPVVVSAAPGAAPSDSSEAARAILDRLSRRRKAKSATRSARRDEEDEDEAYLCEAEEEAPPTSERRATVRYYNSMNPERMYPLLVILSRQAIAEVVKKSVSQAASEAFTVRTDQLVEIEPVLPGCSCYPPRELVSAAEDEVSRTFYVVPHVLGKVMMARVVLRQDDKVLAEVPLELRVRKQTATVVMGALTCVLPSITAMLKQYRLDFETQKAEGFALYAEVMQYLIKVLRPEILGAGLLGLTVLLYLWMRPRRRDVFWDIKPVEEE
jgi:hypothetical protein